MGFSDQELDFLFSPSQERSLSDFRYLANPNGEIRGLASQRPLEIPHVLGRHECDLLMHPNTNLIVAKTQRGGILRFSFPPEKPLRIEWQMGGITISSIYEPKDARRGFRYAHGIKIQASGQTLPPFSYERVDGEFIEWKPAEDIAVGIGTAIPDFPQLASHHFRHGENSPFDRKALCVTGSYRDANTPRGFSLYLPDPKFADPPFNQSYRTNLIEPMEIFRSMLSTDPNISKRMLSAAMDFLDRGIGRWIMINTDLHDDSNEAWSEHT